MQWIVILTVVVRLVVTLPKGFLEIKVISRSESICFVLFELRFKPSFIQVSISYKDTEFLLILYKKFLMIKSVLTKFWTEMS